MTTQAAPLQQLEKQQQKLERLRQQQAALKSKLKQATRQQATLTQAQQAARNAAIVAALFAHVADQPTFRDYLSSEILKFVPEADRPLIADLIIPEVPPAPAPAPEQHQEHHQGWH